MTLRDIFSKGFTAKAVLVLWLAHSAVVLFILKKIEWTLVYGLFETDYGLRYSNDWGVPYAANMYTIYFFVAVPMALSAAVLVLDFWTGRKHAPLQHAQLQGAPLQGSPVQGAPLQGAPLQERKSKGGTPETPNANMLISCPSCRKVFSRPLTMLDFNGKTPKLVNICPYCNSRLMGEKPKQGRDESIGVLKPEQKKKVTP